MLPTWISNDVSTALNALNLYCSAILMSYVGITWIWFTFQYWCFLLMGGSALDLAKIPTRVLLSYDANSHKFHSSNNWVELPLKICVAEDGQNFNQDAKLSNNFKSPSISKIPHCKQTLGWIKKLTKYFSLRNLAFRICNIASSVNGPAIRDISSKPANFVCALVRQGILSEKGKMHWHNKWASDIRSGQWKATSY